MKLYSLILLSLTLTLISSETSDYTFEGEVLILNKDNFHYALDEFQHLLVHFYDPNNEDSQKFIPEFSSAAQRMAENNPEVKLAQVDVTSNEKIGHKYYIQTFPTLKFFRLDNDGASDYRGELTSREIIDWLSRRTGTASLVVKSVEEVEVYLEKHEAVALFIGTLESSGYEDFSSVVIDFEDVKALRTTEPEVIEKYGGKENNLIVFNTFGKEKHIYEGTPGFDEYVTFISDNKYPAVIPFSNTLGSRIFQAGESASILFLSDDEASQKAAEAFNNVATELKGQIIFATVTLEQPAGAKVAAHVGVEKPDFPCIRLVVPYDENKKYMLEGEITEESIKKFVNDALNGTLTPYLKSERVPAEPYDGNVRIIVAKTYDEIVMDNSKDVLVEFYTPWCSYCKALVPTYEKIAAKYRPVESLVIGKLDGNANEIKGLVVKSYPTLKLWKKNDKKNPVLYQGSREEDDIIRFLKEHDAIPSEEAKDGQKPDIDL